MADGLGRLSPQARGQALRALGEEVADLLVVGAGATGCGTAVDAAARGLRVGLIDAGDIAGGTSSRSSKLVHGGLRYLQSGDVGLVREALRERDLLLTRLAPTLVRPLPFLLPLRRARDRAYLGAGLRAYDLLARSRLLPPHEVLSVDEARAQFPDLAGPLSGALRYYDAQMDDARLGVALARTAASLGAHVASHVRLVEAAAPTDRTPRVRGLTLRDETTGEQTVVRARSVALCVGPWAPEVSALFAAGDPPTQVERSKGVHLRLPRRVIDGQTAVIAPTDESVLFVLPSPTHWLVGTTDTPYDGPPEAVAVDPADVDYLLDRLRDVVTADVRPGDVTYAFAGVRPLARDGAVHGSTARVSREHRITEVTDGVLAIAGGKWTTYRVMARDLVDTVVEYLRAPAGPCRTEDIALLDPRIEEIAELVRADPELANGLFDAPGFTRADVVQAVRHDGACTVEDVVRRRLRLPLELDEVGARTLAEVETLTALELAGLR